MRPATGGPARTENRKTIAMWLVYIVECADKSLYTGITSDLEKRMSAHAVGKGAKYTKPRRPLILRYTEAAESKGAALRREAAIKSLDRATKLTLIDSYKKKAVSRTGFPSVPKGRPHRR